MPVSSAPLSETYVDALAPIGKEVRSDPPASVQAFGGRTRLWKRRGHVTFRCHVRECKKLRGIKLRCLSFSIGAADLKSATGNG